MVIRKEMAFQAFKYAVYLLLAVNTVNFFLENLAGSNFTYEDGFSFGDIIVAFTDTIDTAAWLVLLLLLELETFVLEDEQIKGWVDWLITGLTFFCGAIILYALYGYWGSLGVPLGFDAYAGLDPCSLTETSASLLNSLDDYSPLTPDNCASLSGGPIFYNESVHMFANEEHLSLARRLAWTDVLNASIWVVIVVVIELEVFLQSSRLFGTRFFYAYKASKLLLYGVLFVCAYYWWMLNEPWDAWDAVLWLVAFFFIEMNMLSWQEENAERRKSGTLA